MSRNRSYLIAISISAFLLNVFVTAVPCCPAEDTSYIIDLANGGTLTANSCRVDGDRLVLGYPVGDAVIPLSSVKSVKSGDTEVLSLLQEKGAYVPPSVDNTKQAAENLTPEPRPGELSDPAQAHNMPVRNLGPVITPGAANPPPGAPASDVKSSASSVFMQRDTKVDKFVDEFLSGNLTDEEIDREMNALFNGEDKEPNDEDLL